MGEETRQTYFVGRLLHILVYVVLLAAIPLGWVSDHFNWGTVLTFFLYALAIVPLAGLTALLSDKIVTRGRTSSGEQRRWGGLFGALLDNLSFIILGLVALSQGLASVVQASIAGVIISNTLLVLGLSFFIGTMRGKPQIFNGERAKDFAKLLAVIVTAFVLLKFMEAADPKRDIKSAMSALSAIVVLMLFVVYIGHEFFHWNRFYHKQSFAEKVKADLRAVSDDYELSAEAEKIKDPELIGRLNEALSAYAPQLQLVEREKRPPGKAQPLIVTVLAVIGVIILAVVTGFVSNAWAQVATSISSGTYPITIAGESLGSIRLSPTFIGLILVPLIGSAAEHFNSIRSAMRGETEDAVNNTAGAAIQVTLLAAPILVLASIALVGIFGFAGPAFSFEFEPIELAVFGAATFIFYAVTEDGEGTWLEGAALIAAYVIFAFATLLLT